MDAVLAALADQHAEIDHLVAGLDDAAWARPSRCEGWSVADVLLHLAQTDEAAIASLSGSAERLRAILDVADGDPSDVDGFIDAMVAAESGAPGAEVLERWRRASAAMRAAFAICDPAARVPWVVGEMAARSLATTRITEAWIHAVDMAHGLGVDLPPTDRLWHVARLAWRTVPYAAAHGGQQLSGPVGFTLTAPDGSTWEFGDGDEPTVVTGPALDLCEVAGQRRDVGATALYATGPDADVVLATVRTFA